MEDQAAYDAHIESTLTNAIGPEKLRKIVLRQVRMLWKRPERAELVPPLMVWGPPGVGKSTILREAARELGIGFVDVRLAQREPVDVRGLPVPNREKNAVEWLVASDWPREGRGILLFDELTAADRTLQVAAYELILDRRLGDLYSLPPGWYVCAAGNRVEDAAVATGMSSALANRFLHVELVPNAMQWTRWAVRQGVHRNVVGFLRFRPDMLFQMSGENLERGWPSPRAWERVGLLEEEFEETPDDPLLAPLVRGLVGDGVAAAYLDYRKASAEFDDIRTKMLDPAGTIEIPEKADRRYALCMAVSHCVWSAENEEEQERLLDGFYRVSEKLPGSYASMLMTDAMAGPDGKGDPTWGDRLVKHPGFAAWRKSFGALHSLMGMAEEGA